MKYTLAILCLLLALATPLLAQPYQVDWSPENTKEGGLFSSFRLVGLADNSYHLLMRPRRSNTLVSYDLNHRLIDNQSINFEFGRKDLQLSDLIQTSAGRFAYFAEYDKREDLLSLFVSPFQDGQFGNIRQIHKQYYPQRFGLNFGRASDYASTYASNSFRVSNDYNMVAYSKQLPGKNRRDPTALSLAMFDAEFNLLWEKIKVLDYGNQDLSITQTIVGNDGAIYLLARLFESTSIFNRDPDAKGLPRYSYKVFRVSEDDFQTFDVELAEGTAPQYAGVFLPDDNPGNFVLGGFYTTNERRSGLKGLFLTQVGISDGTTSSKTYPLEEEFLEGLIRNRDLKKDRGLNSNFRINNFLQFGDGSFGFVAEEYYQTTSQYTDAQGNWRQTVTYHSDQIVLPRFSAAGDFLNIQKIDKTYSSQNLNFVSYSLALANSKTYLVYNDRKRGRERRELRKEGRDGGLYTDMTVIDEKGEITYQETLFSSRDIDMVYLPRQSDFTNEKLLLLAVKGKRYKCGLIDLRE